MKFKTGDWVYNRTFKIGIKEGEHENGAGLRRKIAQRVRDR